MIAKLVNIKPNVTMIFDTQITILSWCLYANLVAGAH